MAMFPEDKTLSVLSLVLLSYMVVVTSHPDNSVLHKRSVSGNSDSKLPSGNSIQPGVTNPFSTANGTVVVTQTGGTATLPCNVKKHNSAVVTWIRKRDHHLLTVGVSTYSHDTRFGVLHARHVPVAWPLVLRKVHKSDRGIYECQLATHPPSSILIELKVLDAYAEVEGAPDIHVRSGSDLKLVCRVKDATEEPEFLFWYHGNKMINYDTSRGVRVSDSVAGNKKSSKGFIDYVNEITLPGATTAHAGNYSCVAPNAIPANVTVHVHDDAACPTFENQTRIGQETGLIVQCPLATKDRQEIKETPVTETDSSRSHALYSNNILKLWIIVYSIRVYGVVNQ